MAAAQPGESRLQEEETSRLTCVRGLREKVTKRIGGCEDSLGRGPTTGQCGLSGQEDRG